MKSQLFILVRNKLQPVCLGSIPRPPSLPATAASAVFLWPAFSAILPFWRPSWRMACCSRMATRLQKTLYSVQRLVARPAAYTLACLAPAVFIIDNIVDIGYIRGPSMSPLFNTPKGPVTGSSSSDPISRDTVILSKWNASSNVQRGDVVSFWSPSNPNKLAVKRVVAIENDEVQTRQPYPFRQQIVPAGHVWVEGDNPEGRFSRDSNDYGPISKSLITGKVFARLWPNPTWLDSKEWENSEKGRRNVRIRRNIGDEMESRIFR